MTQPERLRAYLEQHPEGITRLEAVRDLGIMNLWCRISDVEQQGAVIEREDISVPNRYGKTCRVTRYKLLRME